MIRNNRGIAEVALLVYVIAGLVLLFVPNPVSNVIGVGVRPNKTIYTEKETLIYDKDGVPYAMHRVVSDKDLQQKITFWEWLTSLPVFALFLMGLGVVFPAVSVILQRLYARLKNETKKIVVGVDKALDKITDPTTKQTILGEMEKVQDFSTKKLVDQIQGKK